MVAKILVLTASLLEIIGVLLMANAYGNIAEEGVERFKVLLLGLVSAFCRGTRAEELELTAELTKEDRLSSLQGLSFIVSGFVLLFISTLLQMVGVIS